MDTPWNNNDLIASCRKLFELWEQKSDSASLRASILATCCQWNICVIHFDRSHYIQASRRRQELDFVPDPHYRAPAVDA
jgi:hypothetical protein